VPFLSSRAKTVIRGENNNKVLLHHSSIISAMVDQWYADGPEHPGHQHLCSFCMATNIFAASAWPPTSLQASAWPSTSLLACTWPPSTMQLPPCGLKSLKKALRPKGYSGTLISTNIFQQSTVFETKDTAGSYLQIPAGALLYSTPHCYRHQ